MSDEQLLKYYWDRKDQKVIATLFDRYIHLVFASCMKYLKNEEDSQDAAMVIFESLADKLEKHKVEYFKSWLYTLTRNHCLMQLRKKNIIERIDNFEKFSEHSVEISEELHLNKDNSSESEQLKQCLLELKEEQRICIELMYLKGLSYKAIADQTGFDLKNVKSFIQNGKRNLKIKLEKQYDNDRTK